MATFPFEYANINGVPCIKSRSVKVTADSVNFGFRPDWDRNPFRGMILVYLSEAIPDGTAAALPVTFTMAGNTQNVTLPDGTNLTAADVSQAVYLLYYDRFTGVLQLLSAV